MRQSNIIENFFRFAEPGEVDAHPQSRLPRVRLEVHGRVEAGLVRELIDTCRAASASRVQP